MHNNDGLDFKGVLQILNRKKYLYCIVLFSSILLTLVYSLILTPTYQATAIVLIELNKPQPVLIQKVFNRNNMGDESLNNQYLLLQSRSLVKTVIQKLHLEENEEVRCF